MADVQMVSRCDGQRPMTGIGRVIGWIRGWRRGARSPRDRRLERFIAESRDVIFETDTQGCWTFLNGAWEALSGRPVDECLGESSRVHVVPEDWARIAPYLAGFAAGDRQHVRMELRYRHANGGIRFVEAMCQPFFNANGHFAGTNGLFHDITERRDAEAALAASEARYRLLVEGAADALVDIDAQFICRYVSPAFVAVAGLEAGQILGHSFFRHTHPDDLPMQRALLDRLGDGRCRSGICQYRMIDNHAQVRWIEAALHARIDAEGRVCGFFGAIRDVTEIVSVVAELELLQGALDTDAPRTLH